MSVDNWGRLKSAGPLAVTYNHRREDPPTYWPGEAV